MTTPLKPFGERIVLTSMEEGYSGKIVLPEKRQREYRVGRCVAVGNGCHSFQQGDVQPAKIYTAVGETYLFQVDEGTLKNCAYKRDGATYVFLHQADMIAKLNDPEVRIDTIDAVGHWVIVKMVNRIKTGVIVLPENMSIDTAAPEVHFIVEKVGNAVSPDFDLVPGTEIALARSRLTTIQFDNQLYGFISDNFIYGLVEKEA